MDQQTEHLIREALSAHASQDLVDAARELRNEVERLRERSAELRKVEDSLDTGNVPVTVQAEHLSPNDRVRLVLVQYLRLLHELERADFHSRAALVGLDGRPVR